MNQKADVPARDHQMARLKLPCGIKVNRWLFGRHQAFPGATQCQLDSKGGGQKEIDFSGFDFLKVTRGNLGFFGECILRQTLADPFTADVCTENLDSLPFFSGNSHDILHRFGGEKVNDTYIVKKFPFSLPIPGICGTTEEHFNGQKNF
jgi:hypothetical protein